MPKSMLLVFVVIGSGVGWFLWEPSSEDSRDSIVTATTDDSRGAASTLTTAANSAMTAPRGLGPFELSSRLCEDRTKYRCVAATTDKPVSELLPRLENWEEVKALNRWGETEVSLETVVPARTWIVFSEVKSS